MSHYEAREGRGIWRDGMPFAFVERVTHPITGKGAHPADVDDFAARAVACVNALAGLDPAGLAGVLAGAADAVAWAEDRWHPTTGLPNKPAWVAPLSAALAALRGKGG